MNESAQYDLTCARRAGIPGRTFARLLVDLTGASFKLQVRQVKDTTGAPLLELDTAGSPTAEGVYLLYAGTATIATHIADGRLRDVPQGLNPATLAPYALGDSILLSQLSITVAPASAAALPFAEQLSQGERGDDVTLYYDLIVTPASGPIFAFMAGKFIVVAGVTIP